MSVATIPVEIADPINHRILAISEDQLQGFQTDPLGVIARQAWPAALARYEKLVSSEEERRLLGHDLWPIGVKKNRANLERFMEYSRDQGLTKKAMAVDSLFAESVLVS